MMSDYYYDEQRMYLDTICELGAWALMEGIVPDSLSSTLHYLKLSLDKPRYE